MSKILNPLLEQIPAIITRGLKGLRAKEGVTVVIPEKPTAKGRPRHSRHGHCYTPKATLDAERLVKTLALTQLVTAPRSDSLAIEILAIFPVPASWSRKKREAALSGLIRPASKPDFDNLAKLYCDALNGVLWHDDKQIVDGRCIKCYGSKPAVILWCWPVN